MRTRWVLALTVVVTLALCAAGTFAYVHVTHVRLTSMVSAKRPTRSSRWLHPKAEEWEASHRHDVAAVLSEATSLYKRMQACTVVAPTGAVLTTSTVVSATDKLKCTTPTPDVKRWSVNLGSTTCPTLDATVSTGRSDGPVPGAQRWWSLALKDLDGACKAIEEAQAANAEIGRTATIPLYEATVGVPANTAVADLAAARTLLARVTHYVSAPHRS